MGKGEETRQAILDRALDIASVRGLEGLHIGALAEAVGMSKSGLFAHFKSKEQLQVETLRHGIDRFVLKVIAPALRTPRGEARVRALFDAQLRWERDELPGGCLMQTAIVELDDLDGPARDLLVSTQRDWLDTIAQIARAAVEQGAFRRDLDVHGFAFDFANLVGGYRRHARLLRDPDAESLARASFERLLERARA